MTLLVLGLNHRTAPLVLRERLAVGSEALPAALASLAEAVAPGVILSTCNRLEIYTQISGPQANDRSILPPLPPDAARANPDGDHAGANADFLPRLRAFMADYWGIPGAELAPYCYHYQERECVQHLFRVASGLDSMVVGEWEILGQVRDAFSAASVGGRGGAETGPGPVRGPLSRLFHQALRVGRRARHNARLGGGRPPSVSQEAVRLAHRLLADLAQPQVLLIGAGAAGQLAGRALAAAGTAKLTVTNRTYGRAAELSQELGGTAAPFERLCQALADSDAVISTTSSPHYLLRPAQIQEVMAQRRGRPLLFIDIAVPRDIDPDVGLLEGVRLCDIDDLRSGPPFAAHPWDRDDSLKSAEIDQAEALVVEETAAFMDWWESLDTISAIAAVREYAEQVRQAEVNKTVNRLRSQRSLAKQASPASPVAADEAVDDELDALADQLNAMTSALVKKLLHHPTVYLREAKDPVRQQLILELFNLPVKGHSHDRG